MELDKFMDVIFKYHKTNLTRHLFQNVGKKTGAVPWWFVHEIKDLSNEVNFSDVCGFDSRGICVKFQGGTWISRRMRMCCCGSCRVCVGHLEQVPRDIGIIKVLAEAFDEKTGFWSPSGCKLPRKYRSVICLTYVCIPRTHKLDFLTDREKLIMDMISNMHKYYNQRFVRHRAISVKDFVKHELTKTERKKRNGGDEKKKGIAGRNKAPS